MPKIQYFLGGNTPQGFYSLYHQLSDPDQFRAVYIIKSGPGSGKSSLMRRVGRHVQATGLDTEEVLCSGDPDSLDALIVPALGAAIVDGTAPQGAVPLVHFRSCGQHHTLVVVPKFLEPVSYLEVCRMTRKFAARQGEFSQEYFVYCKKIERSMAAKGPPADVPRYVNQALSPPRCPRRRLRR